MKKILLIVLSAILSYSVSYSLNPKREFRGAWLHTVFQDHYLKRSTAQNQAYLREQLDKLKAAGINAVVFQVRPQSDAFYESKYEPWSRFLTANGAAPSPKWDPLSFIIDEAHARGMELHAWLNPYRVTSSRKQTLPKGHIYNSHPDWFLRYDGKLYFDPGIPESREFITKVVMDIVDRYDVDGIHFDDYFYPYPVKGLEFPDSKSFAKYGKGMKRDDWRRKNVDMLIEGLHKEISAKKPWVIFGISPFGIWRNKKSDPRGSDTNGLQNYDALYADVLLWAEKGWIDYLMPQLYWDLEHKSASYLTLVDWWNNNAGGRHLFVGQDVSVTMKKPDIGDSNEASQLRHKVNLTRNAENIQGNCWWPGYSVCDNTAGVADSLSRDLQSTLAIPPAYPWISTDKPQAVKELSFRDGMLSWEKPATSNRAEDVVKFVVYRFNDGDEIDLENPEAIAAITWQNKFNAENPGIYIVTALNRANQESGPSKKIRVK